MGMSGATYNANSNQITKLYYHTLLEMGRFKDVYTKTLQNGHLAYFIYNQY